MRRDTANVLVLHTGGTIGMREGPRGFEPVPGHLARLIEKLPHFHEPGWPRFTMPVARLGRRVHFVLKEYDPLLDSSNMGPDDWARIATDIERHYQEFDAFVVLHGTDTMAYSASALSFMLENLGKTVVFTGSQIPLGQPRNDAIDNLLGALTIAGHYEIPEVCLFFANHLLRGNRVRKVDAEALDAFDSGNFPPLVRAPPPGRFRVYTQMESHVASLRIFPGITADVVSNFLRPPVAGLVLETFGVGNAPDRRADLLAALKDGTDRGVVVVNCTQCARGTVRAEYAAGTALAEVGVVPGGDMTTEAALAKLSWLLGRGLGADEVRRLVGQDLRGELTEQARTRRFSFKEREFVRLVASALGASRGDLREEDRTALESALLPVLLCSAAALGDTDALRRMAESGADLGAGDYDGRTALHLAASEGRIEAVEFLLERGVPREPKDRWGGTPLDDAQRHGHPSVVARLTDGAR